MGPSILKETWQEERPSGVRNCTGFAAVIGARAQFFRCAFGAGIVEDGNRRQALPYKRPDALLSFLGTEIIKNNLTTSFGHNAVYLMWSKISPDLKIIQMIVVNGKTRGSEPDLPLALIVI